VTNDVGDVPVIFDHFLVMTAALIGGAGLNPLTHENVNLHQSSLFSVGTKKKLILN
jgi:hypothetical protein